MGKQPTFKREQTGALAFANKVREKLGLKPMDKLVKGNIGLASHCPITNTILARTRRGLRVSTGYRRCEIYDKDGAHIAAVPLTEMASRFARKFDEGSFPDLSAD